MTRPLRSRVVALASAVALLLPALPSPVLAQSRLPALGDPSGADFGVGTERKLGDEIMREIRVDPEYLDDPVLLEYIQGIFQPLVAQARVKGNITPDFDERMAWEPFLVRDSEVNAFALPGGYVGVNLGLMAMTSTRDELASVLAHEMSHITQRHIARSIANSKNQTLLGLAAMLLGILAASKAGPSSGDAAVAAVTGSQALMAQGQLNFSRDMEREADRVGFAVMAGAGFQPSGMVAMFEKLDQTSRLNDSGGFPYLRSHPLTTERIAEARSRLGTVPPAPPVSVLEHTAAQARARVLMDPRFDALRRWEALDADRSSTSVSDQLLSACASGLAATLLHDWSRADAAIGKALGLVNGNPRSDARAQRAVLLLHAQSLLARGDAARARTALQLVAGDGSRPVLLLEAQIALAQAPASAPGDSRLKSIASDLQTWVALHPLDSLAWSTLSETSLRLNEPLRAIRSDAEARLALGDLSGAADRLRAGQQRARSNAGIDFIDASVIDARLRDVETLRRQQASALKELR